MTQLKLPSSTGACPNCSSDKALLRQAQRPSPFFLREIASLNSSPRYFFWSGIGKPKSAVANWQRPLSRLFELAEIKHPNGSPKRCHAHMFGHTFAINMLLKGMPVEDVARLLGHSSMRTTEKYYAAWIKARADRLEQGVMATWA